MFNVYEFHWQARNRFGQKQKGKQLAEQREQIEQKLLQQGFNHIRIQRNFVLPQSPKSHEITQIIQQLALLLGASMPLKQSLSLLLENCRNIKLYRYLTQVIVQLESGFALSQAMAQPENYLNAQEIQLIKMGEKSGKLAEMLNAIAQNRQESENLTKKVKKILFYPLMILGISITLSVLMLLFIVPKFAELYGAKSENLPTITAMLFKLSDILQHSFGFIAFSIIFLWLIWHFFVKKLPLAQHLKSAFLSKIPIFSDIIATERLLFFCQNSGLMLTAHLRLDAVLQSFCNEKSDPMLSRELQFTLERLKQGYSFSQSLPSHLFPNDTLQMISIGEKSSKLAEMLSQIAAIYRQKLNDKTDMLSQMLEPMLMLVMGLIVGTILVGLYLPIFDMGAMIE